MLWGSKTRHWPTFTAEVRTIIHTPHSIRKNTVVETIITLVQTTIPQLYIWHTYMVWLYSFYPFSMCLIDWWYTMPSRGDGSKQTHKGSMHAVHTGHTQYHTDSDLAWNLTKELVFFSSSRGWKSSSPFRCNKFPGHMACELHNLSGKREVTCFYSN